MIDIAGDGPNNDGRLVSLARDAAVAKGITINGLPILQAGSASSSSIPDLDHYYRACVIGGADAFVVPVREADHFPAMVRTKIVREIAGGSFEARFIRTSDRGRELPDRRNPQEGRRSLEMRAAREPNLEDGGAAGAQPMEEHR